MGHAGFTIDDGFVLRTAAQRLNIRYDEIDDTPTHVLIAAWEDFQALRGADLRSRSF